MATFLPILAKSRNQLAKTCRACGVRNLYLFGSAVTADFDPERSDLDFFVEMNTLPPLERGENILQLWNELEALFNRPVDLLSDTAVQNPYLKRQIDATKVLVYDGASEEVLV